MVGLCWERVCAWFEASVWWVRFRRVSVDWREEMCCWRNEDRVERESEIRRSEERSLSSLKCDVHCAMSWTLLLVLE